MRKTYFLCLLLWICNPKDAFTVSECFLSRVNDTFQSSLAKINIFKKPVEASLGVDPRSIHIQNLTTSFQSKEYYDKLNLGPVVENKHYTIYRSQGLGDRGLKEAFGHIQGLGKTTDIKTILYMNAYGYGGSLKENIVGLFKKMRGKGPSASFAQEQVDQSEKSLAAYSVKSSENSSNFSRKASVDTVSSSASSQSSLTSDLSKDLKKSSTSALDSDLKKNSVAKSNTSTQSLSGFKFEHPKENPKLYLPGNTKEGLFQSGTVFQFPENVEKKLGLNRAETTSRENFYQVLKVILTSEQPLIFHCKGGIHRTGMAGLMLRHLQGDEWLKSFKAQEHPKDPFSLCDTSTSTDCGAIKAVVRRQGKGAIAVNLRNPAEVEYAQHNNKNFRQENLNSVRVLAEQPYFNCLKGKFSKFLSDQNNALTTQSIAQRMASFDACAQKHAPAAPLYDELDQLEGKLSLKKASTQDVTNFINNLNKSPMHEEDKIYLDKKARALLE